MLLTIHHHTGGLETPKYYDQIMKSHSPPHRWLRKYSPQ
ncbi:hypothetical protein BAZOLSSOX_310 [uncultured Gammaproteobacteria bacterium]|nr:hypothetical protein BAZOLSSOX_310 [uncultured Gammaproteobacteria bacterium]